jgi:hypothetical protein
MIPAASFDRGKSVDPTAAAMADPAPAGGSAVAQRFPSPSVMPLEAREVAAAMAEPQAQVPGWEEDRAEGLPESGRILGSFRLHGHRVES